MKGFQLRETRGMGGLVLREGLDKPEAGPEEVLIQVRATSLNFRDFMIAHGRYPVAIKPDVIPLSDGAGDVIAVGSNVTAVKVGDRVTSSVFPDWIAGPLTQDIFNRSLGGPRDGMLAEYAVLPQHGIIPYPSHLTYEEAATLPNSGVTAWHALVETGEFRLARQSSCWARAGFACSLCSSPNCIAQLLSRPQAATRSWSKPGQWAQIISSITAKCRIGIKRS
jgi:NADPH:quinone reductase-like Zn-dependent oxidoreductase